LPLSSFFCSVAVKKYLRHRVKESTSDTYVRAEVQIWQ